MVSRLTWMTGMSWVNRVTRVTWGDVVDKGELGD